MPTPQELREKLWKALRSDMIVMLGVKGPSDHHKRPMAAQITDDETSIWFFGDNTTELAQAVSGGSAQAEACFSSKGHDLFACVHGSLVTDNDRAKVDALWNQQVAAWYPEGKDDPKLVLFRFDPAEAEIWDAQSSLLASVKSMFGVDPAAESEAEKHATVPL
jgi:general stress protein 26